MNIRFRKEIFINLSLLLLSTVVSIIFIGTVMQVYDSIFENSKYKSSNYYVWKPYLKRVFLPIPEIMPGIYNASNFTINSEGIRGQEIKNKFDGYILAVGGSTTECLYLDDSEAWPQLLQTRFNANKSNSRWVGNIGKSGLNSLHHVLQLRYLLKQYPYIDTVIILLGINDLQKRVLMGKDFKVSDVDLPEYRSEAMSKAFEIYPYETFHYKNLKLYKVLRLAYYKYFSKSRQDASGSIYIEWRNMRKAASEYIDTLPDLSLGKKEFLLHLNKIVQIVNKHDVRLILLTQPSIYHDNMSQYEKDLLWLGYLDKRGSKQYYSIKAMRQGLEYYNNIILDFCNENNVECLDLASKIPKNTTAFYDDDHFNENGSRLVADNIYQYLINHPTPPLPSSYNSPVPRALR